MRLMLIAKIGLAALFIAAVANLVADYLPGWTQQGEGGIVIVDSPEVYSRERLINDRFRQVAWLEDELDEARNKNFGNQAIADLRAIWKLDSGVKIGDAGSGSGTAKPAGDVATTGDADKSQDLTVSPSERFSDMLAYREEIRTEMMETLLDDRHDIKGNTLYRLKLDTTVLPEENTSKMVVIQARLRKAPFCKENGESADSHPCISIDAIHREWMRLTQETMNVGVDAMVDLIRTKNLPTDTYDQLSGFLLSKIDDTDADGVDWRDDKLVNLFFDDIKKWESSDILAPIPMCEAADAAGKSRQQLRQMNCFIPAYEFYYRGADPRYTHRYTELRKLLFAYYKANLNTTFQYDKFYKSHLRSCYGSASGDKSLDCSRVFEHCPQCTSKDRSELNNRLARIRQGELNYLEARNAEIALLRFAIVHYTIDRYTHDNDVRKDECEKLVRNKGANFVDKSLSCLAHIEKTNCSVESCAITVSRLPLQRKAQMQCSPTDESQGEKIEACDLRGNFRHLLGDAENIYSYAISPKESVQRVLTIESERRQKQLAMSLVAKLSAGALGEQSMEGLTQLFADDSSYSEQVKRKPLIVSFGRGQPRTTVPRNQDCADHDCATEYSATDFGWILGPKLQTLDSQKSSFKFVQVPAQHSLSAVVSVPSWWTAIDIDIESCWIEQGNIREQESEQIDNFCDDDVIANTHRNKIKYTVRLPGSPSELPRKFGYDIERAPWIERNQQESYLADFFVGQRDASLIIKGNELWRSTVVTIGNQKADQIEVLPNMKGIIATFDEIKLPHRKFEPQNSGGGPGSGGPDCSVRSEVIVWTSEGRTNPPHFVNIHPNPNRFSDSATDKATPVPNAFKQCMQMPGNNRPGPGQQTPNSVGNQPGVQMTPGSG